MNNTRWSQQFNTDKTECTVWKLGMHAEVEKLQRIEVRAISGGKILGSFCIFLAVECIKWKRLNCVQVILISRSF